MINSLERFLVVLGAFQPLITFLIGIAAIYISVITYRNAYLTRKHEELIQLSKIKRDLYVLDTKKYVKYLQYKYQLSNLKDLIFESDLDGNEAASIIKFVDELVSDSKKELAEQRKKHEDTLESISKLTDINTALDFLYKVESLTVKVEELLAAKANKNLGLVKTEISIKLTQRELKNHT